MAPQPSDAEQFLADDYRTLGGLRRELIMERANAIRDAIGQGEGWEYRVKYIVEAQTAFTESEIVDLEHSIIAQRIEMGLETP